MERETTQQIVVIAHYSDGSTEDVTRTTQFDCNDAEMAEVSVTGLVTTGQLTGSVAVMARYQGHVGVFRATIPLGVEGRQFAAGEELHRRACVQEARSARPASVASLRRRHFPAPRDVDIAGRLPTLEEAEQFLADQIAEQARGRDRSAARQHRLCRLLCQQVECHPAQQATSGQREAVYLLPSTIGFATA